MEVLASTIMQGWLEGYTLTGRHGVFATYEAFAMIVDSMTSQHAKWLKTCQTELPWRRPIPSLNYLLTSTCWRNDHNGFSHQGPGFIDSMLTKQGIVSRIYLPPDANCLLSVADHCLRSHNYINLIVIDKQPHLQYLNIDEARGALRARRFALGLGQQRSRRQAGHRSRMRGRCIDEETLAAAWLLRKYLPADEGARRQRRRFDDAIAARSASAWNERGPFVTLHARHGRRLRVSWLPAAIHEMLHGRTNPARFHVRGYMEEGTTTTPFDMVVLNKTSRFHLCLEALRRAPRHQERARELIRMPGRARRVIANMSSSTSKTFPRSPTGSGRPD